MQRVIGLKITYYTIFQSRIYNRNKEYYYLDFGWYIQMCAKEFYLLLKCKACSLARLYLLFFVLLSGKSENIYHKALSLLKEELNILFSHGICGFELALIIEVRLKYSNVSIWVIFHYGQSTSVRFKNVNRQ